MSGHSAPAGTLWRWMRGHLRVTGRAFRSLLPGTIAVLGAVLLFRQGLLPLIDVAFAPGEHWLSLIRRSGILLSALLGYAVFVRWHESRVPRELHVRPLGVLFGVVGGVLLVGVPIALLFALGAYEVVVIRGLSSALAGAAVMIGIAALLEELVYRCLLFRVLERAWGTGIALAAC